MFSNDYCVSRIELSGRVKHFCPLGNDWCSTAVEITATNLENIPDYCDVTEFLSALDGQSLTIEDLGKRVYDFMKKQTNGCVFVTLTTADARHISAKVTISD